jgi:ketose-bisphosphate aldolase
MMTISNTRDITLKALREGYAVPAFNITNIVQMYAVIETAQEKRSPVIIQTSVAPSRFFSPEVMVALYRALASSASVPIALHLDHCIDVEYCKYCAEAGYTSVMIDASKQPFEENINQTRLVVQYCHTIGNVSVEGELGRVYGVEDHIVVSEADATLCVPEEAVIFVERTDVDLLAPAIGTAHGLYKGEPRVDLERLKRINLLLNGERKRIPLVIHGGTGLPVSLVQKMIALGAAKFNVSTELKHTLIDTTKQYLSEHPEEYEPLKIDTKVKETTKQVVGRWMDILGSSGKAN